MTKRSRDDVQRRNQVEGYRPEYDQSRTGAGPAVGEDAKGADDRPANTNGLDNSRQFNIGPIHILTTGEGFRITHDKVGHNKDETDGEARTDTMGFVGEQKVGSITIDISGDGDIRLRHENVGTETEVASELVAKVIDEAIFAGSKKGEPDEQDVPEAVLAGVLEDAFFTRKIEADGTVKDGNATKA